MALCSLRRHILPVAAVVVGFSTFLTAMSISRAICKHPCRGRTITKPRDLRDYLTFEHTTRMFTDIEFRRVFRMTRKTFGKLIFLMRDELRKENRMGRRSGSPTLWPKVRLGVLLLFMAGARVRECVENRLHKTWRPLGINLWRAEPGRSGLPGGLYRLEGAKRERGFKRA